MADDKSFGGGKFISFKSGDFSGSTAGIPDKKRSRDQQYFQNNENEEEKPKEAAPSDFVDNSSHLRATLNSLAILNVANIIRKDTHSKNTEKITGHANPIK